MNIDLIRKVDIMKSQNQWPLKFQNCFKVHQLEYYPNLNLDELYLNYGDVEQREEALLQMIRLNLQQNWIIFSFFLQDYL
jgi:hypothetical protein